jgi:hypothetical protein
MGDDLEARAREFWARFYAVSPFQTDRPHENVTVPMLVAILRAVRDEEREASAQECDAEAKEWLDDEVPNKVGNVAAQACARRIRARGGR